MPKKPKVKKMVDYLVKVDCYFRGKMFYSGEGVTFADYVKCPEQFEKVGTTTIAKIEKMRKERQMAQDLDDNLDGQDEQKSTEE